MLYCLLFVKSSFTELFKVIMVAILHCNIWSKFWINCNLRLEKYVHNDKKSILHYALIPFFSCHPRLENDWSVLQESAITRKRRTTYASLEAKLQQQKFSGWWSQIYNGSISLLFHLLNIGQKSYLWKTPDATLCTLKIWDLKAWLEFWVYNNSRSHSPTRCSCCCGKRKWEVYTLHDGCECAHFDKSCWGF